MQGSGVQDHDPEPELNPDLDPHELGGRSTAIISERLEVMQTAEQSAVRFKRTVAQEREHVDSMRCLES